MNLFGKLGFLPHPEKSVFEPTRKITFLGFVINSLIMRITLTPEKTLKVYMACIKLSAMAEHSILELSQVIGLLVASLPAVQYGQLHYRHLEIDKTIAFKLAKGNYLDTMCLAPAAKVDLALWLDNILQSKNPISHGSIDTEITCDASKKRRGAVCNRITTRGTWTTREHNTFNESQHINELELPAIKFALKAFEQKLSGKNVKILCDNTTAVCYINSKGGTKSHHATTSLATFGLGALKAVHGLLLHTFLGTRIQMQTRRAEFLKNAQNCS